MRLALFLPALPFLALALPQSAHAVLLNVPIACTLGENCFIQNYVDHDPSKGWTDYRCGHLSYDGHDGTDFRLPSKVEMDAGVNVLAAADGVVKGVRNDMPDINMKDVNPAMIKDRECGNGLTISHEDGWETQYCHMKKGSVKVKVGSKVKAGKVLGQVGLSGQTEFPHLHLTLRHDGQAIDPFTGREAGVGCGQSGFSEWSPKAQKKLVHPATGIIGSGFTSDTPDLPSLMEGKHRDASLPADAPALIFWTQLYGTRAGDVLKMRIIKDEKTLVEKEVTLEKNEAEHLMYIGTKKFSSGEHVGSFTLTRETQHGKEDIISEETKFAVE